MILILCRERYFVKSLSGLTHDVREQHVFVIQYCLAESIFFAQYFIIRYNTRCEGKMFLENLNVFTSIFRFPGCLDSVM